MNIRHMKMVCVNANLLLPPKECCHISNKIATRGVARITIVQFFSSCCNTAFIMCAGCTIYDRLMNGQSIVDFMKHMYWAMYILHLIDEFDLFR